MTHVLFDLVRQDNQPTFAERGDQLMQAHRMAGILLARHHVTTQIQRYNGANGEELWLPRCMTRVSKARLVLEDIDVQTIAAFAEIAAVQQCAFVPCDGGPTVPANAEALILDITQRALRRVRPPGKSMYEVACESDFDFFA